MKKLFKFIIILGIITPHLILIKSSSAVEGQLLAANKIKKTKSKKSAQNKSAHKSSSAVKSNRPNLVDALRMAKQGQYEEASKKLFQLSMDPYYKDKDLQIKYILGLMLYEMKLYQTSAFQFINIIKRGDSKYLKQSLEKLSLVADYLGDDTLLNYAIAKVKVNEFPASNRDMLYYRIGEFQYSNEQLDEAITSFDKVSSSSRFYAKSKYMQGLAYSELKDTDKALEIFNSLLDVRSEEGVTDLSRVAALIGKARVLYQGKKWDESIEAYRDVPRDTRFWHDSIFESSWAMLRSGKFRSALSNFHTIHSGFYENTYQPESLILRGIIYLYICKYQEMEKVLNQFDKIYTPVHNEVVKVLGNYKNYSDLYDHVAQVGQVEENRKPVESMSWQIPFVVSKKIFYQGDFRRNYEYIKKLNNEIELISKLAPTWRDSAIGKFSKKILETRRSKAESKAGRIVYNHLEGIKAELFDLMEQQDFIRFEMIKGKKQVIKKQIAGKDISDVQVDEKAQRDYYVQNGYEYWPFKGEYWLDELGNYHYVGVQACE